MKRTIIIDTDNNLIELLQEGYHIIEKTFYDEEMNDEATKLLNDMLFLERS
jgi:regulator of replication initiation timing